jgi:predicted nucleic acid-binding protein
MPRPKARKAKTEAVIDTSCLTCLLYLGLLQELVWLYETIRIPRHVWNEVYQWNEERRKQEGKPSIYQLQSLVRREHSLFKKCYVTDAYRVQVLTDRKQNPKTFIHRGEAEAIIQASELQIRGHNVTQVLIDERKGAEIAQKVFGFNVRGTAGILALLERDRIIEEKARGLLERCRDDIGFHISEQVINQVLKEYGIE